MAENYALPPRTRLMNLINESNPGANLTLQKVTLGPVEVSTVNNLNSSVELTAIPGTLVLGQRRVWFDRLNLTTYFENQPIQLQVNDPQSSFDLLQPMLEQYNTYIGEDDVILEAISSSNYTLKAHPNSYGWIGQVTLSIIPVQYPLESILTQLTLDAFDSASVYLSSAQQLLEAINAANGTTIPLTSVTFSQPAVDTTVPGADTRVRVTAIAGQGFTGFVDIRYRRLAIATAYPEGIELSGSYVPPTDGATLLGLLTSRDNVKLAAGEVQNLAIASGVRSVYLTLTNASLVWAPNGVLGVTMPKVPLSYAYGTTDLPGFTVGDITVDGYTALRQLVNLTNSRTFAATDLEFSDLTPIPPELMGEAGLNTQMTISASATNADYTGSVTVSYRRIAVTNSYPDPFVMPGSAFAFSDTWGVLSRLQSRMNFALAESDVVNVPTSGTNITLTLSGTHPVWLPGSTFQVIVPDAGTAGNILLDGGGNLLLDGGGQLLVG